MCCVIDLLLSLGEVDDLFDSSLLVLEHDSVDVELLPHDELLCASEFQCLQRVLDTECVLASLLSNLTEILSQQLLLTNELDTGQSVGRQLDGLVETVLTT